MRFSVKRIGIASISRVMTEEPLKKVNELAKGNGCINKLQTPFSILFTDGISREEIISYDSFRVTFCMADGINH